MLRRHAVPHVLSVHHVVKRPFERLESRMMLSSSQPSFSDFSSTTGLVFNGYGIDSFQSGADLQLTDLAGHEARSAWWSQPVPADTFTTRFSFRTSNSVQSADGLTFTIQNGSTSQVGASGANLGYTGIPKSVAVAFNIYNGSVFGSRFGFASNGLIPQTTTDMTPADLHNGDVYNALVRYNGTKLSITVTDATDPTKTFSASEKIDIPKTIGGDNAIVGFTAATGDEYSPQKIATWTYSGSNAPTVVTPAAASRKVVTGTTVGLSVLGGDHHGESTLKYTWSLVEKPSGARTPKFSANGTNAAKSVNATFFKAGKYIFRCTILNQLGLTTTSDVPVTVRATATALRLIPHIRIVSVGEHINFQGSVVDQFGHAVEPHPRITYAIKEGAGSLDKNTGHFVSTSSNGHLVVAAMGDGLTGTVGGTLVS